MTDPGQYRLLPYIGYQTLVYLIRDPNVLQRRKYRTPERTILDRADLVLGTSVNLARKYLPEYHNMQHTNIHYWPNCVDLTVWDVDKLAPRKNKNNEVTVGVAGNYNNRTDLRLLDCLSSEHEKILFKLCGHNYLKGARNEYFQKITEKHNVQYLGFINHDRLVQVVKEWNVGLAIEGRCEYTKFTHHNKIYQYLALGKPVVTLKIHNDYSHLSPYVQSVESTDEYSRALERAIQHDREEGFRQDCRRIAEVNSAKKRAEQFLELLNRDEGEKVGTIHCQE